MSLASTSFWKSTKALAKERSRSVGRSRQAVPAIGPSPSASKAGAEAAKPASLAAAAPAAAPSARAAARPKRPVPAPTQRHVLGGLARQEHLRRPRPSRACRRCARRGAGSASSRPTSGARRRRSSARHPPCREGSTGLTRTADDPQPPPRVGDGAAAQGLDAEAPAPGPGARRPRSAACRRSSPRSRRRAPGRRPRARPCRAPSRRRRARRPDAVAVEVGARRARQHDARTVVAVEDQRLLDRTLGQHDLLGPHLPQALARRARRQVGEVVGEALAEPDEVLVVVADRRGARSAR